MYLLTLSLLALIAAARTLPTDETFDSRFQYEYRVIEHLVHLTNGMAELKKSNARLKQDVKEVTENAKGFTGGSVYVRWGRSTCPGNGTELVYKGFAGGSSCAHSGGAANYLCLPEDPTWADYSDAEANHGAFLYGVEYQFTKIGTAGSSSSLYNHDVPCAVCYSRRPTMLMIPARVSCYDSWVFEYGGYLVADEIKHPGASEFVCVDENPEKDEAGRDNHDGKLFYFTEGRCGSLKCPPYVNGREITCVVCTK